MHLQALAQQEGSGPVLWHRCLALEHVGPLRQLLATATIVVSLPTCILKIPVIRCRVHALTFRLSTSFDVHFCPDVIACLPAALCETTKSSFWGLGVCCNTSFLLSTCKPWHVSPFPNQRWVPLSVLAKNYLLD